MTSVARILVVDDSEDARMIALAMLEDGGFDGIDAVEGAEEAFQQLGLEREDESAPAYDIILLDIVMPKVDGVEACARIRASRRYRDVPILMVSSQRETEVLNQAFIAGANDYVLKPVNQIELLARVRSSLRFKRELDRRRAREIELRSRARTGAAAGAGYGLLSGTALLNRNGIEAHIRAIAENDGAASLLLLAIKDLSPYRVEKGEEATDALICRVARNLATLDAPLGTILGHHGQGVFMAVAAGDQRVPLEQLGQDAGSLLDTLCIHHGFSQEHDNVRLGSWTDHAAGEALLELPARLIAGWEISQRSRFEEQAKIGRL